MARHTLLVVALLGICSGLQALPLAKDIPEPEDFIAQVQNTGDIVNREALKSQQLAQQALVDNVAGKAITKATAEITDWVAKYMTEVEESADSYTRKGFDVSHCVEVCTKDYAELQSHLIKAAIKSVHDDMEDVALTATKAAGLPAAAAGLLWLAQAEVLNSKYGDGVEAILDEAAGLQSDAEWNNKHIPAMVDGLRFAAGLTIWEERAETEAERVGGYAFYCMNRATWKEGPAARAGGD